MHPHRTPPPPSIEAIVSALLPASRREQVLGDLKERCLEKRSYATPSYLLDALTTLPHVWWSTARRNVFEPPLRLAGASDRAISERTEHLLNSLRIRNGICSLAWIVTMTLFAQRPHNSPPFSDGPVMHVVIGCIMLIIFFTQPVPWTAHLLPRRTSTLKSPFAPEPTRDELLQLYRKTIQAMWSSQHRLLRTVFPAIWLALLAVWFVPHWPSKDHIPARIWLLLELWLAAYLLGLPLSRLRTRRLKRELDGLDQLDLGNTPIQ